MHCKMICGSRGLFFLFWELIIKGFIKFHYASETATWDVLQINLFWKISNNSEESTCPGVSNVAGLKPTALL